MYQNQQIQQMPYMDQLSQYRQAQQIPLPQLSGRFVDAFESITALTEISIPETITSIQTRAFFGTGLKEITLPSSITVIEDFLFCSSKLERITIGSSIVTIKGMAFIECFSLTSVVFEVKTGWAVDSVALSEAQLTDSANAATLLNSTYSFSIWTRS